VLVAGFGERVSANFAGFEQRLYNGRSMNPLDAPAAAGPCAVADNCTTAEIANRDWALFSQQVRTRLPGGVAFADTPANLSRTTIVVGWLDTQRIDALNVAGAAVTRDVTCPDTPAMTADLRYRCYVASVYP
jgi:hypothetical protein